MDNHKRIKLINDLYLTLYSENWDTPALKAIIDDIFFTNISCDIVKWHLEINEREANRCLNCFNCKCKDITNE